MSKVSLVSFAKADGINEKLTGALIWRTEMKETGEELNQWVTIFLKGSQIIRRRHFLTNDQESIEMVLENIDQIFLRVPWLD